jgi:hypothetical protein
VLQRALAIHVFGLTLAAGQPPPSTAASAQIAGRVLDDLTSEPLANARVFLYSVPYPGGSRPPLSITNESGEYVFKRLEPGSYSLGVNKSGFLPVFRVRATLVNLGDGERRDGIDLLMSRGGVLAGRVVDESGKPLSKIWVGALRLNEMERLEQAVPSPETVRTDASGVFRLESIRPGQYVVLANRTSDQDGQETDSITYFPGTLDHSRAQFLRIGPRETIGGLDFTVIPAPTFDVSGFAIDHAGRPVSGWLVSLEADRPLFGGPKGSTRSDAEGRFRIGRVSAGDYKLTVTNRRSQHEAVARQTALVRVNIVDADVSGLVIQVPIQ